MHWSLVLVLSCAIVLLPPLASAQDSAAAKPPPRADAHRVKREAFRIEVGLSGIFEAERKSEVVLRPQAWTSYIVERAVEPGARVRKGEPLLVFRTEKIDEEIAVLKAAIEISRLGLEIASDDHRWAKESMPLDLAAALRAREQAHEDLKHLLEVDGPLSERSSRNSVKNAQFSLEYASEELRQLEKMYKADDLTEDTEEIILTRARRDVEQARFSLEATTVRSEHALKTDLPRRKDAALENARRQEIALEKITTGAPKQETKRRLDLLKQRSDLEKEERRLEKLLSDREGMTVPSPQDGIVYYGRFNRGKWLDAPGLLEELKPGNAVQTPKAVLTVVEARPLWVRADVAEKDLSLVRAGVGGKAAAASLPGLSLSARVERVSAAPVAPGIFDARIAVELPEEAQSLLPGMECSLKLVGHLNREALTVPPAAVFADEGSDEKPYVYRLGDGGKPEKRSVKLGQKTEAKVEILEGLAEGDEALTKRPEGEGK